MNKNFCSSSARFLVRYVHEQSGVHEQAKLAINDAKIEQSKCSKYKIPPLKHQSIC